MRPVAAASGDELGWKVGDKAQHGKWGTGTVVSVKGQGEGTELDIAFPSPVGIKRLLAKFAPINKV
jgi:DNA helicase-2/ATP-dependent DNA helicase PcrA